MSTKIKGSDLFFYTVVNIFIKKLKNFIFSLFLINCLYIASAPASGDDEHFQPLLRIDLAGLDILIKLSQLIENRQKVNDA